MAEIGYFLSSEETGPKELLRTAQLAADAGIETVWISDHYHPWLHEQGESPFVWSVIGAIAATTSLRVSTAVTCPTMRIHPAVVAQAAATAAVQLDGRFELGVGSGENLNEHIFGDRWPVTDERLEMLEALGLGEGGLERFIHAAYQLMGLRTYFTTGEKETRAWTFRAGAKAPQCAGIIHTDFERGFIRAEVIHWDELLEIGSWTKAKELGKVRVEGKDYVVADGDVLEFRFNV